MIGPLLLAAGLAAGDSVRSVEVPARPDRPVLVHCPVDQVTRIVLPERLTRVTASAGAKAALGIMVERYQPEGVLVVHPQSHPARGRVDVRGPTTQITLQIESVASGVASEVHLVLSTPATESIGVADSPSAASQGTTVTVSPSPAPSPSSSPQTIAEPPAGAGAADAASASPPQASAPPAESPAQDEVALLSGAEHVAIGRREGLPGQKEVVLVDALRSEDWVWLRFAVRGGASERVERVEFGAREMHTFVARREGRDLRVTVKLPRAEVGKKARVSLALASGARYTFPLTSSSFTAFIRGLFK